MIRSYFLRFVALGLSAAVLGCQGHLPETPQGPQPRTELSGVWIGPALTAEPPAPMTPRGQALFDAAKPIYGTRSVPVANSNDPIITCDPIGFPRILLLRAPLSEMEIVQTPNRVFQFFRYQQVHREIWTDGHALPTDVGGVDPQSPDPKWYGYSSGRWADDGTFVVETVGATETWGDEEGHPHSLGARIEESYRLRDKDTLELTVTIDDPEMYEKPFVASRQRLKRGKELTEQLCVPSLASQYLELVAKPAGR